MLANSSDQVLTFPTPRYLPRSNIPPHAARVQGQARFIAVREDGLRRVIRCRPVLGGHVQRRTSGPCHETERAQQPRACGDKKWMEPDLHH